MYLHALYYTEEEERKRMSNEQNRENKVPQGEDYNPEKRIGKIGETDDRTADNQTRPLEGTEDHRPNNADFTPADRGGGTPTTTDDASGSEEKIQAEEAAAHDRHHDDGR